MPSDQNSTTYTPSYQTTGNFAVGASNLPSTGIRDIGTTTRYGRIGSKDDSNNIYQYPLDLEEHSSHYIVFHIYQSYPQTIKPEQAQEMEELSALGYTNQSSLNEIQADAIRLGYSGSLGDRLDATLAQNAAALADLEKLQRRYQNQQLNISKQSQASGVSKSSRINEPSIISKDSIVLYMPQKLNSMNMLDYEIENFEVTAAVKEAYQAIAKGKGDKESFVQALSALGGKGASMLLGKVAGGIGEAVGLGNPMDIVKVLGRVGINPQKEMLFNAPAPRKYEFVFEFAPRSEEESYQVRNIIQAFKFHSYPAVTTGGREIADIMNWIGDGVSSLTGIGDSPDVAEVGRYDVDDKAFETGATWYRMPAEFQFEYMFIDKRNGSEQAKLNHYLNRAERCVLSEINVDYSGAGQFQSFENGAPTHITLTLTFSEARLLTQEHITHGY